MRQRLITKTQSHGNLKKQHLKSNNIKGDSISLHSLLYEYKFTKNEWQTSIIYHSRLMSNLLLNNHIKDFDDYLAQQFDSVVDIDKMEPIIKNITGLTSFNELDHISILKELLQTAVLIEHSTIPPYLTALYSIKDGTNLFASQTIRSVVVEEMLHLIMVCNVMNAVNIQPSVNKPHNYPVYPMKLPMNVDFYIGLEAFSTNSIATFIDIERPSNSFVNAPIETENKNTLSLDDASDNLLNNWTSENMKSILMNNVHTIGEYYDLLLFYIIVFQIREYYKINKKLPHSLNDINKGGILTGNPLKQISSEQYYGSGGKLYVVESLLDIIAVFQEIKGQGEGAGDSMYDVDPSQFEEGVELAHYFRFKEIFHEHYYKDGNYKAFMDNNGLIPITTPPIGAELNVNWDAVYPMKPNPKMIDYQSNQQLYEQSKKFNQTYKNLLDAIQFAIEGEKSELEKSIMYMYALKEQAIGLMNQPLDSQYNAGPTFEYPIN